MKLLFLANRTPYPPYRGDKLKIFHLAKRLAAKGHELHLLSFAQCAADREAQAELERIFASVNLIQLPPWKSALHCLSALWDPKPLQVLYFQDAAFRKALLRLLEEHHFDAIHVQHLRMAPYLAGQHSIPRILDLPDAFSLYWQRRAASERNFFKRLFQQAEYRRVLHYEPVIQAYDMTLACSDEDIQYLRKTHHADKLRLLPNGVDLTHFAPRAHDYSHHHTLLFTGNMDYAPNVDAVLYFHAEILPLIRRYHPQIRFVIAGQHPLPSVLALAGKGVEVTGFVKDLAEQYNAASVVVAPLRFGAGTQNKVLEAMAMGIPVVCSEIGFAGLGIAQGQGAFRQNNPEDFAQSVLDLLESESLRCDTGRQGIEVMRERFGWDAITTRLEGYFEELTTGKS
ncbi:MAG: glycosyltransferase [Bacteroidetes bacterium]|nr:glycosyltransferase [Bacteroidota bacterium]